MFSSQLSVVLGWEIWEIILCTHSFGMSHQCWPQGRSESGGGCVWQFVSLGFCIDTLCLIAP